MLKRCRTPHHPEQPRRRRPLILAAACLLATSCGGAAEPGIGTDAPPLTGTSAPPLTGTTLGPYDTYDPSAPGVTGTVLIWEYDVEWAPGEAPGPAAIADLERALYGTDLSMILPTTGPPPGTETAAELTSQASGWGSGATFPETTTLALRLTDESGWEMSVTTFAGDRGTCREPGLRREFLPEGQATPPEGLSDVVAIAAGWTHSLAVLGDGTVVGWGNDEYHKATPPSGLSDVVDAAGGYLHSLALRNDGTVVGWGYDEYGQAEPPGDLSGVVDIGAGYFESVAVRSDGTVVGWGEEWTLEGIEELRDVVAVGAGTSTYLFLQGDGTVADWGWPPPPEGLVDVVAVAQGGNHSLALGADGTVVGWAEYYGQDAFMHRGQADPPDGLNDVIAIAAGEFHSLALRSDGTVVGWGDDYFGQATPPAGLSDVVAIAAGDRHSLALRSDGTVVGWGDDAPETYRILEVRGDTGACVEAMPEAINVNWVEAGQAFEARVSGGGLDLDPVLEWLETWRLMEPPLTEPTTPTTLPMLLEWDPAQPLAEADMADLVAQLDELDRSLVIPVTGSPTGTETSAELDLAGDPVLVVGDELGLLLEVAWESRSPWDYTECLPEMTLLGLRGDTDACLDDRGTALWSEAGESLSARIHERPDFSVDAALAWLETWQMLPFACEPGWADADGDASNGCEYTWMDSYEPNDNPLSAHALGTIAAGQIVTVSSTVDIAGGDGIDWFALEVAGPGSGGDLQLSITGAPSWDDGGQLFLFDYTDGSLTGVGDCVDVVVYEGGCPIGGPVWGEVRFGWRDDPGAHDDKLLLIKMLGSIDYELSIALEE